MTVRWKRTAAVLAAGMLSMAMAFTSMADWQSATSEGGTYQGVYDEKRNGSLDVTLYDRTTVVEGQEPVPVADGKISLIKLADIEKQYTTIAVLPEIAAVSQEIAPAWDNLQDAETIKGWQAAILEKESDLSALIKTQSFDSKGNTKFADISQGIYMVFQKEGDNAKGYQYVEPYIVSVPTGNLTFDGKVEGKDGKSVNFVYDLLSTPKVRPCTSEAIIDPPVKKVITDRAGTAILREDRFDFLLEALDGAPLPEGKDIGVRKNGDPNDKTTTVVKEGNTLTLSMDGGLDAQEFGIFRYTEPGTYKYRVYEKKGSDAAYAYDSQVYDLTVTVTLDRNGVLVPETNYDEAEFVFTNVYTPNPQAVDAPAVTKVVNDAKGNALEVTDKFTFKLTALEGAPLPAAADYGISATGKKNDASTTITKNGDSLEMTMKANLATQRFGLIRFKEAGTYKYQVSEVLPGGNETDDKYAYDTKVYDYTVTVTEKDGKLSVSSSPASSDFTFTNISRGITVEAIRVKKKVKNYSTGAEVTGDSRKFTFELRVNENRNPSAPMPAGSSSDTLKIVKAAVTDGAVTFGEIPFNEPGTYYYTVTERKENNTSYLFDTKTFWISIKVEDQKGALKVTSIGVHPEEDAEPISDSANGKILTFTNQRRNRSGGGGGGGGNGGGSTPEGDIDIPLDGQDQVLPEDIMEIPLTAPQTGDQSRMILFGGITVAAIVMLGIWMVAARRSRRD